MFFLIVGRNSCSFLLIVFPKKEGINIHFEIIIRKIKVN